MKTIYCTVDFVYVSFDSDIIKHNCVLSLKNEDCMFFVCDHNTNEEQFREIERSFFDKVNISTDVLSESFHKSQQRFYESKELCDEQYRQRVMSLKREFETLNIDNYNVFSVI